ncbi:NYN domain-containing protein [Flavobacterium sp.]
MKTQNLNYVAASMDNINLKIEVHHIDDYCQIIERHHIKEVFVLQSSATFAIAYQHLLLVLPKNGYNDLHDYHASHHNGFTNSDDFYEAKELNITTFHNFEIMKSCGIEDQQTFLDIQNQNYLEGFQRWMEYKKEHTIEQPVCKNPYELFLFATQNKFENFNQFFEAFQKGFTNLLELNVAIEKGFSLAAEYRQSIQMGFTYYEEYKEAIENNIESFEEYEKKKDLEFDEKPAIHDQKVLLLILNKIEQGKKVSLNKIKQLLEGEIKTFHKACGNLPDWFTLSLKEDQDFVTYLLKNEKAVKLGDYDADGEFYEMKALKERSVLIDGSNVAHNSNSNNRSDAKLCNLITMVKFLKKRGFQDITIIADASLRHKVTDKENFQELEKEARYYVAPAETTADSFLLALVKSNHSLLVSNDVFREYRLRDPWVAANIDYFRLTFLVKDNDVIMPELEK